MNETSLGYPVVVCGSNYGLAYVEALEVAQERFPVAALLARGSERSKRLAQRLGIPLCTKAEELPPHARLACAALPASADDVVLALLARGIHVLCEHPRGPAFLERARNVAAAAGTGFEVNGHFSDLPAARTFAEHCRALCEQVPFRFVEIVAQERSLYAALDILGWALPGFGVLDLERTRSQGGFVSFEGGLALDSGARGYAGIRVQVPDEDLADGSARYLVDVRLAAGFDTGVLSLLSITGPVAWNANLAHGVAGGGALWQLHGTPPTADDLRTARAIANREALERLVRLAEPVLDAGHRFEGDERLRHTLAVSRAWDSLGARLRSG